MSHDNLVLIPNAKLAQAIVVNQPLPSPDLAVLEVRRTTRLRKPCPCPEGKPHSEICCGEQMKPVKP